MPQSKDTEPKRGLLNQDISRRHFLRDMGALAVGAFAINLLPSGVVEAKSQHPRVDVLANLSPEPFRPTNSVIDPICLKFESRAWNKDAAGVFCQEFLENFSFEFGDERKVTENRIKINAIFLQESQGGLGFGHEMRDHYDWMKQSEFDGIMKTYRDWRIIFEMEEAVKANNFQYFLSTQGGPPKVLDTFMYLVRSVEPCLDPRNTTYEQQKLALAAEAPTEYTVRSENNLPTAGLAYLESTMSRFPGIRTGVHDVFIQKQSMGSSSYYRGGSAVFDGIYAALLSTQNRARGVNMDARRMQFAHEHLHPFDPNLPERDSNLHKRSYMHWRDVRDVERAYVESLTAFYGHLEQMTSVDAANAIRRGFIPSEVLLQSLTKYGKQDTSNVGVDYINFVRNLDKKPEFRQKAESIGITPTLFAQTPSKEMFRQMSRGTTQIKLFNNKPLAQAFVSSLHWLRKMNAAGFLDMPQNSDLDIVYRSLNSMCTDALIHTFTGPFGFNFFEFFTECNLRVDPQTQIRNKVIATGRTASKGVVKLSEIVAQGQLATQTAKACLLGADTCGSTPQSAFMDWNRSILGGK